jgi:leucine dehydrogenase
LARLLREAGASTIVTDLNSSRAATVAEEVGATVVAPDEIVVQECDVLAPCALGGTLHERNVMTLRCRAVCGAANNQLEEPHVDDLLADRGILYAPDFVANAGGIINIAEEFIGYSEAAALERVGGIDAAIMRVFAIARERRLAPGRAAVAVAHERIEHEGAGRWQPGSATAWTAGAPLRTLRPADPRGR